MKVGSIGYATHQGLGILLKSFYDAGIVTDVLTVHHWKYINYEWYNGPWLSSINVHAIRKFAKSMDVMFFFETPFDDTLIEYCKSIGVKTILMPMYECTPYLDTQPDLILNPSDLDQFHYPAGRRCEIPVDGITWSFRHTARNFVHNSGHGGLAGRNGTDKLIAAMQYVKSPIRLTIRSQDPIVHSLEDKRVSFEIGTKPYRNDLYAKGDVFIFPEKFNGLSLPLQEAYASGMLVMATDRFPMNNWLPTEPLIPVGGETTTKILNEHIKTAVIHPISIARQIDKWFDKDISEFSAKGLEFNKRMTWKNIKQSYVGAIEELCQGQ